MRSEAQIVIDYVLPDRRHAEGRLRAPMPSYTLALLLAQTPATLNGCRVVARVHDEQVRGRYYPRIEQPDILCLTYLTTGAPRAFEISEEARAARSHAGTPIKIVHGGVHATCLPNEALLHCNLVVRGEITPPFHESILGRALAMRPEEKDSVRLEFAPAVIRRPPADWSWMRRKDYILAPTTQTSVGCPFHCDFCSVTQVFGAAMRAVSEEGLRRELELLPRKRVLAIIDDNFLQGIQPRQIEHCMRVAEMLHELGFKWVTEATVRTLIDARERMMRERSGFDLIEFFAKHGCRGLFLGIETIQDGAGGLVKQKGADETLELIRCCHSNGIGILGAFVLGLGSDETPEYAKRLLEFAIDKAKLDFAQFSINTPMPGARNFLTGTRDGTIFNFDWELYDAEHCVMRHPKMSPEQLEETHRWLYEQFYGYRSIGKRYDLMSLGSLSSGIWRRAVVGIPANLILHRTNRSWNDRIDREDPREIVPEPHPAVLRHVSDALGNDPCRPGELFDFRPPKRAAVVQ